MAISGGTPEAIAVDMVETIAKVEGIVFEGPRSDLKTNCMSADRKWILDTYAQCLQAAKGERVVG